MSPSSSASPDPAGAATAAANQAAATAATQQKAAAAAVSVGTTVRLSQRPRYLRSADPMPMLRPPDLIDTDECGVVVEQRALMQVAVRFRRGTFLLEASQLQLVEAEDGNDS